MNKWGLLTNAGGSELLVQYPNDANSDYYLLFWLFKVRANIPASAGISAGCLTDEPQ